MINFDELIDNYLVREIKPKVIGRYYPSEIGSCMRKVWYSYKMPKETEKELRRVFWIGEMIHNFVVDVIKSERNPSVELQAAEFPFAVPVDDFVISGRVDDIVLLKVDNKQILVEVKSTADLSFTTEPKESHVIQLLLYMRALTIFEGFVLYVEKNTLATRSFPISYDTKLIDLALNRFRTLHKHLLRDLLPDPEARIVKTLQWMCGKCPYREECYQATPASVLL